MLEICTGSVKDCLVAAQEGAKQVELNSALSVGGLTPSLASLRQVKEKTDLIVNCMVRPRAAGFCYDEIEKVTMMEEARLLLEKGADGIVFGFLKEDGTIHSAWCQEMVSLIHSYGKTAIFHRAFDVSPDPYEAMETLIQCGVDRVLTSGQKETAWQGRDCLKELQARYGKDIEILMGSGVHAGNAKELMEFTACSNIHSSCKGFASDPTTIGKVSYSYLEGEHRMDHEVVLAEKVKELVTIGQ